jgi:hypothetical protein
MVDGGDGERVFEGEVHAVVGGRRSFDSADDVGLWVWKLEKVHLGDGELARAGADGELLAHVTAVCRDEQAPAEVRAGGRVIAVCAELRFSWAGGGRDGSDGVQVRRMEGRAVREGDSEELGKGEGAFGREVLDFEWRLARGYGEGRGHGAVRGGENAGVLGCLRGDASCEEGKQERGEAEVWAGARENAVQEVLLRV